MKFVYLVTGAAGFIGSAVSTFLSTQGNEVITIDNLSTGLIENIPDRVKFYKGNCQDINIINQLESYKFDAIIHIAGQSSGEISFEDPVYDLQTNAQSTLMLLRLALKTNCKKFIYASTMSVYGDHDDLPVSEMSECVPKSFYAVGKIASEHYMRIYQKYGITCTALRLFNVYGPGQNLYNLKQGMVSIFIAMALTDKLVHVKGDKKRFRDFVYIDDVVDAFWKALSRPSEQFKIYNVCTGIKTTIENLITSLQLFLPDNFIVKYSGSTPGDQYGIYGDYQLIYDELGWMPQYSLNEGLNKMIDWALKKC